MKALSKIAAAALLGAGALTLAATSASARRLQCRWWLLAHHNRLRLSAGGGRGHPRGQLGLGPERQIPLARARRPRLLARRRLGPLL